ncbi:MAG: hypothetical protein J6P60_03085 [Lachnospiraceae bacterium]|nr:hypothetical protein [Lachnospiraceae bacterium]
MEGQKRISHKRMTLFGLGILFLSFLLKRDVCAEKLPVIATADEFYEEVVTQVENGVMQAKYMILFDPYEINAQEIRGHAFDRGGYSLVAKFSHWSYSWREKVDGTLVSFKTGYFFNRSQDAMVRKVVRDIAKDCSGMSDYDKIKYVYDYIILNCEYVRTKDGAYNNLIVGKSCCNGYAEAFLLLMEEMDIPCKYTVNSDHAWNTVFLDGQWYNIDTTWGDGGGDRIDYNFFLKPNEGWMGEGPTEATARAAYPAEHLERRVRYPNYTRAAWVKSGLPLILPPIILVGVLAFFGYLATQQTKKRVMRNEERIRNLYKLPDE